MAGDQTRASDDHGDFFSLSQSSPGIDKLETPLGIDKSLAFREFDKSFDIGFQKHRSWHWPLGLSF